MSKAATSKLQGLTFFHSHKEVKVKVMYGYEIFRTFAMLTLVLPILIIFKIKTNFLFHDTFADFLVKQI